jgi:gliding motility-associated-like protein
MKKIFLLFFLFGLMLNTCFAQPMPPPDIRMIEIVNDTEVRLCWPNPPSLNGNIFDAYEIYYADTLAGPYTLVESIFTYATTSINITGLPLLDGPRYFYAVTKFNSNQTSVPSATIRSMYLTVSEAANEHMYLTWNKISDPVFGATATNYRIYRQISIGGAFAQLPVNPQIPVVDTTYTDSLLLLATCDETVFYRIEISDNSGLCQSVSNIVQFQYKTENPKPPFLKRVTVTNLPPLQDVTLEWDISPSQDVLGYKIYQLTNVGSPVEVGDVPGRLSITATLSALNPVPYNLIPTLPNSQSENFRIAAYDACNNTGDPGLFHNSIFLESELDECNGIIELKWNQYNNWPQGVANYEIYFSQNGSGFNLLATLSGTDTTYQHFPLIQSTLYTYKVRAIDPTGLNSESNFTEMIADVPVRPGFLYFKYATVKDNRAVDLMLYHDTNADISFYRIFRSDNAGDTFDSISQIIFNPLTPYLTYTDTANCLTFKKSYVYRAVAFDLCGQPVYNSDNIAKTIFLRAATELDMENTITWSDYENWTGEVRSYKVFRGFQGVFSDLPAATIPFGENTYNDDISNRISKDGEYCYYVQAYQGLDTLNFFADSSRSNKVCIKQLKTFYMPNAFEPDGVNKIFKPGSTFLNANNYKFQIFNKWGERVFETIEPTTGWDGTINGREARMDVYVYRITYQNENFETQEVRGTVTLVR